MLNVRISDEEEKELNRFCEEQGISKSMVVKEALSLYFAQKRKSRSAYEAGADLFGQEGSGRRDHSVTYKKKLKKKLNAKHTR